MSSRTGYLHLTKLAKSENFANDVLNDNLEKIDKFAAEVDGEYVSAPAAEGNFGQVLRTNGNGVRFWDNDANTQTVKNQVDHWLGDNISNPDSPPLDRTLTFPNAAAPADLAGEIKGAVRDLVVDYTRYVYPNPRQLFDKRILPDLTGNNLYTNTSSKAIYTNANARLYLIEINGHAGDLYTFNLLNGKSFSDYSISSMEIFSIDVLPQNGGTALQRGSTNAQNARGTITLERDTKYIYIDIYTSVTGEENITNACNGAMENTVVRKGQYNTTYYEYSEITEYDADYKVVPIDQGRNNAGKTLMVDEDGNVYLVSVPDVNKVQDRIDGYLLHVDEEINVNPRQLFDKRTLPFITGNNLLTNTSSRVISENTKGRVYTIEVNAEAGDAFSYNLLNSKTYAEYHISTIEIYASDEYPAVGVVALQRGSSSSQNYRGSITLGQNSKYIYLNIQMNNDLSDETAITNACNSAMENMVVRASSTYDTTYYDYSVTVVETPTYKVVEKDQGTGNAGRMLIVGGDGIVTLGEIVSPQAADGVGYYPLQSVHVGANLITVDTPVTLGDGWSGNLMSGLVHASGNASSAVIYIPLTENKQYMFSFRITSEYGIENGLTVAFGDGVPVDVYGLSLNKNTGFISDGVGMITLNATATVGTNIVDIALYEVLQSGGTEIIMEANNVNHGSTGSNITGFWNVAIGAFNTQSDNVCGSRNVAIGYVAQSHLRQGTRNVALGTFAMPWVREGDRNVAIGADSLYSGSNINNHVQAYDNVAIGYATMHDGPMILRNVAIGSRAMKDGSNEATDNTVVGFQAGNYAHNYNTFVGNRAGYYSKGNYNVAFGWSAGADLYVTGSRNIAIGASSGCDNTGGTAASPKAMDNTIAIGHGVKAKASDQAWFARSDQDIFLAGKKINFNLDGSVTWEDPA